VSTVALAPTGADHSIRVAVVENIHAPVWGDGAYYGGYVLPLVVAPGLYVSGLLADDRSLAGAGSAALQALGVTFATTVLLKVATGRPFPLHGNDPNAPDRLQHPEYATEFSPFGFAGRYAWPSGHTSSAISIAAALSAFSDSIAVPLVAYPLAASIGIGMIVADRHWTSDVIAGACIGQAIGWPIGSAFRERMPGAAKPQGTRVRFVPLLGEIRGLAVNVEL
jgi:membrane-associated phospholipid phosphatase